MHRTAVSRQLRRAFQPLCGNCPLLPKGRISPAGVPLQRHAGGTPAYTTTRLPHWRTAYARHHHNIPIAVRGLPPARTCYHFCTYHHMPSRVNSIASPFDMWVCLWAPSYTLAVFHRTRVAATPPLISPQRGARAPLLPRLFCSYRTRCYLRTGARCEPTFRARRCHFCA